MNREAPIFHKRNETIHKWEILYGNVCLPEAIMILGPPTCVPLEKLPISISPENSNLQQVAYRNNGSVLPERYHRLGLRLRIQGKAVKPSGKYEW